MTNTPLFENRESLLTKIGEIGGFESTLTVGRIEDGMIDLAGKCNDGATLNVIIGIDSFEQFLDLDLTEDDTISDYIHYRNLCVRTIVNGEVTTYFDSFIH